MKSVVKWVGTWVKLLLPVMLSLLVAGGALAQGIIIEPPIVEPPIMPEPRPAMRGPITIDQYQIEADIDGAVASVNVTQVFRNHSNRTVEGVYVFPLPVDAAVSDFQMTVDGVVMEGQLLGSDEARQVYESIVRRQQDPALLEYVGQGLFQTSVFPIPAGESRKLEFRYTQLVPQQNGLFHFRVPMRTHQFSASPIGALSISVSLTNQPGLRTIYSPNQRIGVERIGDDAANVGMEATDIQIGSDFDLFYGVANEAIGLNLLSYKPAGEDGFFLVLASPSIEVAESDVVTRDVILVVDTSGSMEGQKIVQARKAAHFVVDRLNPNDRFNLIGFSTGVRLWQNRLQEMDVTTVEDAHRWIDRLDATGSTDINRALLEGMGQISTDDADRPAYILFLTDGLPTQGETDQWRILDNALNNAPAGHSLRLFTFGIGYDVNTDLLNTLSSRLGGRSSYVKPDEQIDETVSSFYRNISTPVLANVTFDFGPDAVIDDMYPYPLPDLFAGGQLVVAGRYRAGGSVPVVLRGDVNGVVYTFTYPDQELVEHGGEDFVARLWATRKIGALLDEIRRNGPSDEIIEAIVDLSLTYGIVTPYTSYLVQEPEAIVHDADVVSPGNSVRDNADGDDANIDQFAPNSIRAYAQSAVADEVASEAAAPASGVAAVESSEERNRLQTTSIVEEEANLRHVNGKTFIQQGWVEYGDGQRNALWMDTLYEPEMTLETTLFGSERYFELAADKEITQWLAISTELIVVLDGETALRITMDDRIVGEDTVDIEIVDEEIAEPSSVDESEEPSGVQAFLEWLFGR